MAAFIDIILGLSFLLDIDITEYIGSKQGKLGEHVLRMSAVNLTFSIDERT